MDSPEDLNGRHWDWRSALQIVRFGFGQLQSELLWHIQEFKAVCTSKIAKLPTRWTQVWAILLEEDFTALHLRTSPKFSEKDYVLEEEETASTRSSCLSRLGTCGAKRCCDSKELIRLTLSTSTWHMNPSPSSPLVYQQTDTSWFNRQFLSIHLTQYGFMIGRMRSITVSWSQKEMNRLYFLCREQGRLPPSIDLTSSLGMSFRTNLPQTWVNSASSLTSRRVTSVILTGSSLDIETGMTRYHFWQLLIVQARKVIDYAPHVYARLLHHCRFVSFAEDFWSVMDGEDESKSL